MLDTNQRLRRVIGRINTGTSAGSYTYTGGYSGVFFAAVLSSSAGIPAVTVSGSTISWDFTRVDGSTLSIGAQNAAIIFGSY
ncbi:hypothetical protein LP414_27895 [Polaromonas sp. P1(28)-13]|nr:hypothetical protein LP414_27895 [Polaromonas sp. P1(28)-13]